MTQKNVKTGKTRPVQCKTAAHRPSGAGAAHYPHIEAPAVAPKKSGSRLGFLGKALGLGGAAVVGTGIA